MTFEYPKSITSLKNPRSSDVEIVRRALNNQATHGWPLTTGEVVAASKAYIGPDLSHGRVQQILYYLGYRALEGTVKPYGRGHTWVWYLPDERHSGLVTQDEATPVEEPWRDVGIADEYVILHDVQVAYTAAGLEMRVQVRGRAQ